jgi:hypothetical protein
MKKILVALALTALALTVNPVVAAGKKSSGGSRPAPKSTHRGPATTHHASAHHAKSAPAHKYASAPKYKSSPKYAPAAKYTSAPKYTAAKYTPAKYTPASFKGKTAPKYAFKFSGGYYYKKANPPAWTKTSYSNKWRTWFYFVPAAGTWYYYSASDAVYYPMNYATVVTPTVVAKTEGAQMEGTQTEETEEGTRTEETQNQENIEPPVEEE